MKKVKKLLKVIGIIIVIIVIVLIIYIFVVRRIIAKKCVNNTFKSFTTGDYTEDFYYLDIDGDIQKYLKVGLMGNVILQNSSFKPVDYDSELSSIADSLISGKVIVIDLEIENKNPDISRRIIDFLRGTTYAIKGKFVKVAKNTYVLTPHNVEINGTELINELENNEIYV